VSWLGTDVVAVACILGGAATSGAVTMALANGGHDHARPCIAETVAVAPQVVVSSNGEARAFVVAPRVHQRAQTRCAKRVRENVRVRIERAHRAQERARERMERARREVERVRIHVRPEHLEEAIELETSIHLEGELLRLESLELAMEELEHVLESELEPAVEANVQAELVDLQEKIQEEVRKKLEKKAKGGGEG
jgi:hypothetical protein